MTIMQVFSLVNSIQHRPVVWSNTAQVARAKACISQLSLSPAVYFFYIKLHVCMFVKKIIKYINLKKSWTLAHSIYSLNCTACSVSVSTHLTVHYCRVFFRTWRNLITFADARISRGLFSIRVHAWAHHADNTLHVHVLYGYYVSGRQHNPDSNLRKRCKRRVRPTYITTLGLIGNRIRWTELYIFGRLYYTATGSSRNPSNSCPPTRISRYLSVC